MIILTSCIFEYLCELNSLVNIFYMLDLCTHLLLCSSVPVSPGWEWEGFTHVWCPDFCVWLLWFLQFYPGDTPWLPGSGRTWSLSFLGPTGLCKSERQFLAGYHAQTLRRHWAEAHSPVFLWRKPLCLRTLAWGADFRSVTHLVAYRATLKEYRVGMPSWYSPSTLL